MTNSDQDQDFPLAPATLVLGPDDWDFQWRVSCCPLCGRMHYHGGGPIYEDPRRLLTHRLRHCMTRHLSEKAKQVSGYILVDKNPERTIRMMKELE